MFGNIHKLLIAITVIICIWFFQVYGKENYTFYGDALGYYSYLPSAFIYHNFHQIDSLPSDKGIDEHIINDAKAYRSSFAKSSKGYFVNQYTYGVALTELPFFLLAHAHAKLFGLPANGYDAIYAYYIKLGILFYALLGILFSYKILLFYVPKTVAITTCICLLLGTNLFWFTIIQAGMAHVPLFLLYAALLYCTIIIHQHATTKLFVVIGCIIGLIVLIRPTEILCICIPLFYNIYNRQSLLQKIKFITSNKQKIVASIFSFMIPIIPQLVFWKKHAGSFIYYSYGTQTFDWLQPHIKQGLFSGKNGWIIYSPIFIIALIGLLLFNKIKSIALSIYLLLPIYIYITYAWYCFNYINGFGSRPMIHIYSLLAIPLAVVIYNLLTSHKIIRTIAVVLILFANCIVLKLSWQQLNGQLVSESSNVPFLVQTLFKQNISVQDLVTLDCGEVQPKENLIYKTQTLATLTNNGNDSFTFLEGVEYPEQQLIYNKPISTSNKKQWLKAIGTFYNPVHTEMNAYNLMVLEAYKGADKQKWYGVKLDNKIGLFENTSNEKIIINYAKENTWGTVAMYVPLPKNYNNNYNWHLGFWNINRSKFKCKDVRLELWEQK